MGVLDGLAFVYMERIECDWSLRVHLTAGSRVPAYCVSGGKVLLGHLPADLLGRLLKSANLKAYTEKTITRVADLEEALRAVRESEAVYPWASTTKAFTRTPRTPSGSGTPTTAASTTAGCSIREDSTSKGPMRYPEDLMTSSDRPTNQK